MENLIKQTNNKIQSLQHISKYQELYGKIDIRLNVTTRDSIKHIFHENMFQLNEKIPEWSYPFVYKIALEHMNRRVIHNCPQDLCAISIATKTVKYLETNFPNKI